MLYRLCWEKYFIPHLVLFTHYENVSFLDKLIILQFIFSLPNRPDRSRVRKSVPEAARQQQQQQQQYIDLVEHAGCRCLPVRSQQQQQQDSFPTKATLSPPRLKSGKKSESSRLQSTLEPEVYYQTCLACKEKSDHCAVGNL